MGCGVFHETAYRAVAPPITSPPRRISRGLALVHRQAQGHDLPASGGLQPFESAQSSHRAATVNVQRADRGHGGIECVQSCRHRTHTFETVPVTIAAGSDQILVCGQTSNWG